MKHIKYLILIGILSLALLPGVQAQSAPGNPGAQDNEMPRRWTPKSEVESRYGVPLMKSTPVGRPVITFWEYPDYIVYFENDRVLHNVSRQRR